MKTVLLPTIFKTFSFVEHLHIALSLATLQISSMIFTQLYWTKKMQLIVLNAPPFFLKIQLSRTWIATFQKPISTRNFPHTQTTFMNVTPIAAFNACPSPHHPRFFILQGPHTASFVSLLLLKQELQWIIPNHMLALLFSEPAKRGSGDSGDFSVKQSFASWASLSPSPLMTNTKRLCFVDVAFCSLVHILHSRH